MEINDTAENSSILLCHSWGLHEALHCQHDFSLDEKELIHLMEVEHLKMFCNLEGLIVKFLCESFLDIL